MTVLALDFDGVLCDSATETGMTGWKAGGKLWSDMTGAAPEALLDAYRAVRPAIETGYQAILAMRLLKDGVAAADLLEDFTRYLPEALDETGSDVAGLKRLYGAVRDQWMRDDPAEWLSFSPLYPGTAETLASLPDQVACYIVTTKEERFVARLLDYWHAGFEGERIFGLDRGVSKEETLRHLMDMHPGARMHFVEDRLATLRRIREQPDLRKVRLHLACWGYNTEHDRREAVCLKIHLLKAFNLQDIENDY